MNFVAQLHTELVVLFLLPLHLPHYPAYNPMGLFAEIFYWVIFTKWAASSPMPLTFYSRCVFD